MKPPQKMLNLMLFQTITKVITVKLGYYEESISAIAKKLKKLLWEVKELLYCLAEK